MIETSNMMRSHKQAFTLVELLVAISIILVAASIIFVGGNSGEGAKLSASQRIVSGIAQGARGQAILKKATTRLIIYSDDTGNSEDAKNLRFFGIIYQDEFGRWVAATQGTFIPEGIYFDPAGAASTAANSWPPGSTMRLEYPRLTPQSQGTGDIYYYYQFNSNGTMAAGFDNNCWLVLRAGVLKPGSPGKLEVNFPSDDESLDSIANIKTALIFRRAGTTTAVTDPGDIN